MRPDLFTHMISFDEALRRVLAAAVPIERTITVAIEDAIGRVASREVVAAIDVPAFDRAAMDGYAVRASDLSGATPDAPVELLCADRITTGKVSSLTLAAGQCAEIATGAPLPAGADAVVMVERTSRVDDRISAGDAPRPGQNVGRRGADMTSGQSVLRTGDVISPARAGALAAVGRTTVDVFDRPLVAVLSTGMEVTPPGHTLAPGQVYDVNSVTVGAVVGQHGADAVVCEGVDDSVDALVNALQRAAANDVIVTSGGSSVGRRDLLLDALERCGTVDFHGMAVKPGKPTLFGSVGGTPVFGMPGNPTSCLSNVYILLVPFLRKVARLPEWTPVKRQLPLAGPIKALADRHQFYPVRIVDNTVEPAFKSSGDITSLTSADGYIEVPPGPEGLKTGDVVRVVLL